MASSSMDRADQEDACSDPPTVLVLDDDPHLLARIKSILQRHQFQVVCAQTIKAASVAAASGSIAVALIDYRLRGSASGLDFAATLSREHRVPFVMISGYLTTELTVLAMRCGASDVVDKPFGAQRLVESLKMALSPELAPMPHNCAGTSPPGEPSASAGDESISSRWAKLVLAACDAKRDPNTVPHFARAARVSTPVFRSVCSLCRVKPHNACTFGRFLRAIARSQDNRSTLLSHLAVGDRRTASRLFQTAGIPLSARSVPLQEFFRGQGFVATNLECLRELAHCTANSALFTNDEPTEG